MNLSRKWLNEFGVVHFGREYRSFYAVFKYAYTAVLKHFERVVHIVGARFEQNKLFREHIILDSTRFSRFALEIFGETIV